MTPRQAKLLAYIRAYQGEHDGASPTLKQMSAEIGGGNHTTAFNMIAKLERAGLIIKSGWRSYSFPPAKCCPNCGCNLEAA